jgi:hypothetical protein
MCGNMLYLVVNVSYHNILCFNSWYTKPEILTLLPFAEYTKHLIKSVFSHYSLLFVCSCIHSENSF